MDFAMRLVPRERFFMAKVYRRVVADGAWEKCEGGEGQIYVVKQAKCARESVASERFESVSENVAAR